MKKDTLKNKRIDDEELEKVTGGNDLLEILTNGSKNAEKKGTSIVINTPDEDDPEDQEEKTRRAIFTDRSNIQIETLRSTINLKNL